MTSGGLGATPAQAEPPELDPSLQDLVTRVRHQTDGRARWELLLEAVVTLAREPTLDRLLHRIVVIAGALAGARYSALGVLDPVGEQRLRTFVHHGIHEDGVRAIGELPKGHGLLGLIADHPVPVRLHDLTTHPTAYGFPPGHPPMRSFLGVPLRTRERVFGNLYLTEKEDEEDFTEEDERIVIALAAAAGVAVENAELLEETRRRGDWLEASTEITTALLSPPADEGVLQVVTHRAREVAAADLAWIVSESVPGDPESLAVHAVSGATPTWEELRPARHPVSRAVIESRRAVTVDDLATDPRTSWVHEVPGWPLLGPALFVPLGAEGQVGGVLVLAWTPQRRRSFLALDPLLPTRFAEQAALTLQLERAQEDQRRLALFRERDRIGRDLHDVVIQRLFAVGLGLEGLSRIAPDAEFARRLERAADELDHTIKDIRRTIFELSTEETSSDVRAEILRLVRRAAATLGFLPQLETRGPVNALAGSEVAIDLAAVLSEALSNVARHAAASQVWVRVSVGPEVVLEVVDDGRGVPATAEESGLRNLCERAQRHGGRCAVLVGPRGRGTTVRWQVPLPSDGPQPS